jgi:hypothetical protein
VNVNLARANGRPLGRSGRERPDRAVRVEREHDDVGARETLGAAEREHEWGRLAPTGGEQLEHARARDVGRHDAESRRARDRDVRGRFARELRVEALLERADACPGLSPSSARMNVPFAPARPASRG